jgi:hypothetical protein
LTLRGLRERTAGRVSEIFSSIDRSPLSIALDSAIGRRLGFATTESQRFVEPVAYAKHRHFNKNEMADNRCQGNPLICS